MHVFIQKDHKSHNNDPLSFHFFREVDSMMNDLIDKQQDTRPLTTLTWCFSFSQFYKEIKFICIIGRKKSTLKNSETCRCASSITIQCSLQKLHKGITVEQQDRVFTKTSLLKHYVRVMSYSIRSIYKPKRAGNTRPVPGTKQTSVWPHAECFYDKKRRSYVLIMGS